MAINSTTPPAGAPLRLPEEEQWAGAPRPPAALGQHLLST